MGAIFLEDFRTKKYKAQPTGSMKASDKIELVVAESYKTVDPVENCL